MILFAFAELAAAKSSFAAPHYPVNTEHVREYACSNDEQKSAITESEKLIAEIIKKSYPELAQTNIFVKTFDSPSDYFRSRFFLKWFLTFQKTRYIIFVNPRVFGSNQSPPEAIRAIIAHELAHIAYYRRHNRFELCGLVALESKSFTARFERGADLEAIKRGYGAGLKVYREWLYRNIPADKIADKKRDYFSPEEIELIQNAVASKPALMNFWQRNVPRNIAALKSANSDKTFK